MHLVHKDLSQEGKLAVIAIFFDTNVGGDSENHLIEELKVNEARETKTFFDTSNLRSFLNTVDTDKIYNYQGSLTTPPCSEIVNWIIIDDPQPISS